MESIDVVKCFDENDQLSRNVLYEFGKSPHDNVFQVNKDSLRYYSSMITFDKHKWDMNPFQFCFDQYKKQYLYQIILVVNNLLTIFDFRKSNLRSGIVTPYENIIKEISKYILY